MRAGYLPASSTFSFTFSSLSKKRGVFGEKEERERERGKNKENENE
jgi:hypothetical protein